MRLKYQDEFASLYEEIIETLNDNSVIYQYTLILVNGDAFLLQSAVTFDWNDFNEVTELAENGKLDKICSQKQVKDMV